jgi:TonB-dependent receptor
MFGVRESAWSVQGKSLVLSASLSALAAMFLAGPSFAQDTAAPQPQDSKTDASPSADEVVVTGIRASIQRAADIKHNSAQIVDAISSEDLGKLPDTNIAEGLQRITGVQIQRTGGEGNGFQIRGATQNLTLINGREVAPDADTASTPAPIREVNLFNYPSELFSEVLVYKSPSASLIEGGVGGTVDLRMPDPLKAKQQVAISIQGGELSLQHKAIYGGSAIVSHRFFDNTLGVVVGLTYLRRDVTTDSYSGSAWTQTSAIDVTGDGIADKNSVLPLNMTYTRELNHRERYTANALVTWEPTDTLHAYLDTSYIKQTNDRARSFIGFNFTAAQSPSPAAAAMTQAESDGTTTVLAGTFRNVNNTQDALNQDDNRNLYSVAVGATWRPVDRLTISGEVGTSWSKINQFANVYQLQQNNNITAQFDATAKVPTVSVISGGAIDDPNAYKAAVVNVRATGNKPNLKQGKLDLSYDLGDGFLQKIEVGGRLTRSKFDSYQLNNRYANSFPIGTNIPATRFSDFVQVRDLDNFLGGAGSGLPTRFVVTSVPGNETAGLQLLNDFGDPGPLQPIPASNYRIVEKTDAAYVQLDFGTDLLGRPLSGNVGVRYVKSVLDSASSAVGNDGSVTPVDYHNNYGDWLPSLNMKWSLNNSLVVRASAAKVVARPAITSLSAGTTVSFGVGGLSTATAGQPMLKPFRADQYDLGLEYYFGNGGYVSGALFYKDIQSYVTQTTVAGATLPGFPGQTFFLTAPSNGPGGRSQGFEFGVQRSLGFLTSFLKDFGVIGNFTFVDSKRKGSSLQIENTSKYSYNVIGYYEHGPFQARLAYNWRSSQYLGLTKAFNTYANARGQLDASLSFDLSRTISLTLDGENLLETPQTNYSQFPDRKDGYLVNDRSVLAGIRARF